MAITKTQLISDIELQTYQGNISDDAALEKSQIAFWISEALNALVATECNEHIKRQQMIPAVYVKRAALEPLEIEETDADECDERIFITVPDEILTLNKGMGVVRVVTSEGQQVLRASTETLDIINLLRYAKPSNENLVYSQQGQNIFIEGLKPVDLPFDFITVYYVPKQDVLSMDDEDEILVSDLVQAQLTSLIVAKAKSEIYGGQEDKQSNGVQDAQPVYHQQIKNTDQ